ncbi:MAG TPA: ABC transporter substrate-binding protein [Candidatus Acidoferrales bacterium]|nr:ABC transporter substrate-binding protein [Candidatus Acidoferrales bacterium]
MKKLTILVLLASQLFLWTVGARGQGLEKVLITHSSESISIAPLTYGIEKGFYRKEGIDLQFRILRGDLAISSMVSGKEVDYIYGAGTAFLAAVRGAPVKILSHDFKSVLFYLMAQPSVRSPKDLKGKKIAVSSLGGTGAASARACLKALDLDPDKDMTFIVIGAASVRLAAMESGSVEAAIMPVPWNSRMKQKGFKEMVFAGKVFSEPLTGIATSKEKIEKNRAQVAKMLRGFMRSLKAVREEKKDFTDFIGRKFNLEPRVAEETYQVVLQTLTEDGTVSQQVLEDLLERTKKETGIKRDIAVQDIVDYRLLREVSGTVGR